MAVPVVGTNSLNTYIFLVFLIMIKSNVTTQHPYGHE